MKKYIKEWFGIESAAVSVSFSNILTMKIIVSLILIVLSPVSFTKEINISDTGISFVAPNEFQQLSQEAINIKWPQKNAPKWAVGNESTSTTIAYDLKQIDVSSIPLPELMVSFKTTFDRIVPGIQWKKREIIELSGKSWGYLEMTSSLIDSNIHNIMLVTSYGKEALIFNFNSTKEDFPKYELELRQSMKTIQLPNNIFEPVDTNKLVLVEENRTNIEKGGVLYNLDSYIMPFQQPYYITVKRGDNKKLSLESAEKIAVKYIKPRGCTVPLVRRPDLDKSNANHTQWLIGVSC